MREKKEKKFKVFQTELKRSAKNSFIHKFTQQK